MDVVDLEARIATLERQVAESERGMLHLIADRAAVMIVLGALRHALTSSGQVKDDQLRQIADHLFAIATAASGSDPITADIRERVEGLLGDQLTGLLPTGRVN